jgi:hypothetical protein
MEAALLLSDPKDQARSLEGMVDEVFNTKILNNLSPIVTRLCSAGPFSQQVRIMIKPV